VQRIQTTKNKNNIAISNHIVYFSSQQKINLIKRAADEPMYKIYTIIIVVCVRNNKRMVRIHGRAEIVRLKVCSGVQHLGSDHTS